MAFNDFMHERNIYKDKPDFKQIALDFPELRKYAVPNDRGKVYVDFNNLEALRVVTKVLLKKDFNLSVEIPSGYLIPTVPQRLNYILWVEDLLESFPKDNNGVYGIDIGTGPCAIFSLLGAQKNGWKFISTDTSDDVVAIAKRNVKANDLDSLISVVKVSKESILKEVLSSSADSFSFCLCNPPFFDTTENIRKKHPHVKLTLPSVTKESEIKAEGGEVSFVRRMIEESVHFQDRIQVFTSMFGKKKSYLEILKELEDMKNVTIAKTEFCQGNTVRWGIAWTFKKEIKFKQLEKPKPQKPLKPKPPIKFTVPFEVKEANEVKKLSKKIKCILEELEIPFKVRKCYEKFVEMEISSEKNTWSHQRRKRRQQMQEKVKSTEGQSTKDISGMSQNDENIKDHETTEDPLSCPVQENEMDNVGSQRNLNSEDSESKTMTSSGQDDGCQASRKRKAEDDFIESKKAKSDTTTSEQHEDNQPSRKRKAEDDITESKRVKSEISENDIPCPAVEKVGSSDVSEQNQTDTSKTHEPCEEKRVESSFKSPNSSDRGNLILCCTLRLIKCKNHIIVEMNCHPDMNRETMHQVFQLLKNKLKV